MTLGQHIKNLRLSKDLSQPAMADLVGIEQSYLSKIENDKSVPSNDILRKLLKGLNLSLSDLLSPLSKEYIASELCQIPDIETWLTNKNQSSLQNSRKWLLVSSALIAIAITLFYMGYSKLVFSETIYEYRSYGILKEGEVFDYFEGGARFITPAEEMDALMLSIKLRYDPDVFETYQLRGDDFLVEVDNGRRRYMYDRTSTINRFENVIMQVCGVFLLCCGLLGFILERRFYQLENSK